MGSSLTCGAGLYNHGLDVGLHLGINSSNNVWKIAFFLLPFVYSKHEMKPNVNASFLFFLEQSPCLLTSLSQRSFISRLPAALPDHVMHTEKSYPLHHQLVAAFQLFLFLLFGSLSSKKWPHHIMFIFWDLMDHRTSVALLWIKSLCTCLFMFCLKTVLCVTAEKWFVIKSRSSQASVSL